jgi:hypothetical protein
LAKIDTSGDEIISPREIREWLKAWKPSTKAQKLSAVFCRMFRFCGCCLWLFLLMPIIFFGNAVLWPSAPANSKADLGIAGCYFCAHKKKNPRFAALYDQPNTCAELNITTLL